MDNFADRVVLITGASAGIGRGTALEFAKRGARLTITGRNVENLQHTAQLCQKQGTSKENILALNGDLVDKNFVKLLIEKTIEQFGALHVLVNNAGMALMKKPQDTTIDELDLLYKVNLRSVFQLTQLAVPHLIKSKGSIVNVSSIAGIRPLPYGTAYGMMKAALGMYTRTLSLDLGPQGVRVNGVNPGVIETGIFLTAGYVEKVQQLPELFAKMAKVHPGGRIGQVEEVALAIVFLASDASSFISGVELPIDGGRHNTSRLPVIE